MNVLAEAGLSFLFLGIRFLYLVCFLKVFFFSPHFCLYNSLTTVKIVKTLKMVYLIVAVRLAISAFKICDSNFYFLYLKFLEFYSSIFV